MKTIQLTHGRTVACSIDGKRGVPVLFLHGGANGKDKLMQMEPIKGLRLIYIEWPGSMVNVGSDVHCFMDAVHDIKQILDHLKIRRCVLAGHAAGGTLALHAASVLPDRIASLALFAPLLDAQQLGCHSAMRRAILSLWSGKVDLCCIPSLNYHSWMTDKKFTKDSSQDCSMRHADAGAVKGFEDPVSFDVKAP